MAEIRPALVEIASQRVGRSPSRDRFAGPRPVPAVGRGAADSPRRRPGRRGAGPVTVDGYSRLLEQHGFRATPQRRAILEGLLSTGRVNVPAEDVCRRARMVCPTVNLATTYRTLDLLGRLGIVRRLTYGDGRAVFCANPRPHYHGTCVGCGAVIDLPRGRMAETLEREQSGLTDAAFGVIGHRIEFYGYCAPCRAACNDVAESDPRTRLRGKARGLDANAAAAGGPDPRAVPVD